MKDQTASLLSLLEREGHSLYALLFRLTLRRDVAEDLMQELFLKLRHAPGFAQARVPAAYVKRAAFHLALDWRRTRKSNLSFEQLPADPPSPAPSPLSQLIRAERWDRIVDAACQLSDLTRDAFLLRFVQQESYASIAAQLGKTPHQVRALCHRAVDQVRLKLADLIPQPAHQEEPHASH